MAEAVVAGIVLEEAADSCLGVAKRKIGYMWNCAENVENLKKEVESLEVMTRQVQQQIGIAKDKGDNLIVGVEDWLKNTSNEISKAQVFLGEYINAKKSCYKIGMCGNWATLYHYGKGAMAMMTPLKEQKESGTQFVTCVSVETLPPTRLDVYQTKNLENLDTHNSALNAIIAALEDETKQIIGIYGLGGVGKTTLAMEVAARVKKTNMLFADVAFTTVSQNINVENIKKDIGEATKRIMNGDKILIILDDVWDKLNLEELCIPCGNNYINCKILLTSRSEKVCQKMNAQSKICVNPFLREEAWILFKRVVGERVETDANLKPVALKVVEECGGLPLLIQAVGNALKHESIESWSWALVQLQKNAPLDIDEEIRKSFTHLKLSYDYLKSEEVKFCFLLCSMFPEDYDISLENLVYYMVGLHKFDDLDSIEDARGRVQNAVNILVSYGLLLTSKLKGCTKMHDVVRDVALLIASQDINNKYLVKAGKHLTEWQARENNLRDYRGISLMMNPISKLPDYEVHLPILDIFLINENWQLSMISDEFIKGMKEVKVLDLSTCPNAQLPQSLELLTKLRMLNLYENNFFHDLSLLGEMKELEILNLNYTGIKEISKEIGWLVNLRRLELVGCKEMTHVTPGVISKLCSLEELCIDLSRMREGVKGCIAEVMKLSKLTDLDLKVNSFDEISEFISTKYLENMKRYVIRIPYISGQIMLSRSDRYLSISSPQSSDLPKTLANGCSIEYIEIQLLKWLEKMIELIRNPHIDIYGIDMINNIIPTLNYEGVNKVERIDVRGCPNVTCLVDDGTKRWDGDEGKTEEKFFKELKHIELYELRRLEVLWKCPDEYISLTKLVTLKIKYCDKLKRVFTVSIAKGLVNLKELDIEDCSGLEEMIWGGGGEDFEIQHYSSTNGTKRWDGKTDAEKFFKELKTLFLERLHKLEVLWKCPDDYISLTKLVTLSISYCDDLKSVFTVSIAQGLVNLKELVIYYCSGLEQVIWGGGGEDFEIQHYSSTNVVFPSLARITLFYLESLESFFKSKAGNGNGNGNGSIIIKYPSLENVQIHFCESMKIWGPGIHETPNLKTLAMDCGEAILLDGPSSINDAMRKRMEKLEMMNRINTDEQR